MSNFFKLKTHNQWTQFACLACKQHSLWLSIAEKKLSESSKIFLLSVCNKHVKACSLMDPHFAFCACESHSHTVASQLQASQELGGIILVSEWAQQVWQNLLVWRTEQESHKWKKRGKRHLLASPHLEEIQSWEFRNSSEWELSVLSWCQIIKITTGKNVLKGCSQMLCWNVQVKEWWMTDWDKSSHTFRATLRTHCPMMSGGEWKIESRCFTNCQPMWKFSVWIMGHHPVMVTSMLQLRSTSLTRFSQTFENTHTQALAELKVDFKPESCSKLLCENQLMIINSALDPHEQTGCWRCCKWKLVSGEKN